MLLIGWRSCIDMYLFGMWRSKEAASDHLGGTHWLQRYVTLLSYLLAFDSSPNFFTADHSRGMWRYQVDDVQPGARYLWNQTYTKLARAAVMSTAWAMTVYTVKQRNLSKGSAGRNNLVLML
jgi:hypothetical protein